MYPSIARYTHKRLRNFLVSPLGVIVQVYFYLFALTIYREARKSYDKKYKRGESPIKSHDDKSSSPSVGSILPAQADTGARVQTRIANAGHPPRWQWRDMVKLPSYYAHWKTFTAIYMCYVVIKNTIPHLCPGFVLDLIEKISGKPIHCYLLGRFKIHHRIDALCATIWAFYHVFWRMYMVYGRGERPVFVSAWYFLMLDERDIKLYHKLVAKESEHFRWDPQHDALNTRWLGSQTLRRRASLDPPTTTAIDERTQLMHDVMGLRMDRADKVIYKIRPNRTLKASKDFRAYLAHVTIWGLFVFVPIAIGVAIALFVTVFDHQTYLWSYAKCDPTLERLNREHRLAEWSHYGLRHQYIALVFDFVENVVLWLESGLVCYGYVTYCISMNFDLLVYWDHVHRKITKLLKQARQSEATPIPITNFDQLREWDYQIYELQMEMRDFMNQLRQSDSFMTSIISALLTVWFSMFSAFTYGTITQGYKRFPVELTLVLIFLFIVTTNVWFILLILHKRYLKSYPLICSLMALDHSGRKRHFVEILDNFFREGTCYTVYGTYPITATNYLTIVGYTFSCFFLLTSRNYR